MSPATHEFIHSIFHKIQLIKVERLRISCNYGHFSMLPSKYYIYENERKLYNVCAVNQFIHYEGMPRDLSNCD